MSSISVSWVETPLKIDRKVSQTGLQKRAGHSLPPKGGFMATFVTRYAQLSSSSVL